MSTNDAHDDICGRLVGSDGMDWRGCGGMRNGCSTQHAACHLDAARSMHVPVHVSAFIRMSISTCPDTDLGRSDTERSLPSSLSSAETFVASDSRVTDIPQIARIGSACARWRKLALARGACMYARNVVRDACVHLHRKVRSRRCEPLDQHYFMSNKKIGRPPAGSLRGERPRPDLRR